jgi:hypothetical protein
LQRQAARPLDVVTLAERRPQGRVRTWRGWIFVRAAEVWSWLREHGRAWWASSLSSLTKAQSWVIDRGVAFYRDTVRWFFRTRVFRHYRRTRLWLTEHVSPLRRTITRRRGWLSEAINRATAEARPTTSLGETLGFDLTRSAPLFVMALIVLLLAVLALCSLALSYLSWHLGLPKGTSLSDLYTTMWQVQAGIAALALPVLLFVVERSRDDPRAVFRSAEILLRDSYAYHILAFSFVVVGHIGLDLAWFGSSRSVVLLDLVLVGLTLLLAMYAYFKVVQLIMSSSLLRDRSVALAKERLADAAWRTGRRLKGADLLQKEFDDLGVNRWVFETEDEAEQFTVSIRTDMPKYLDDVDVTTLRRFLNRLPRKSDADASTDQVLTAIAAPAAATPPEPGIWYLLDYGSLIRPTATPFLRFRRDAFEDLDEATVASVVTSCVHLKASDDF